MARKRIEQAKLKTWDDADDALRDIGVIDRAMVRLETEANEKIDGIKKSVETTARQLRENKALLELQLEAFCSANRGDFGKVKSKPLTFGTVSFRESSRIIVKKGKAITEAIIAALKELGHKECIRTKETLNKEEMKKLDEETLARVGARKKAGETFGYEINAEKVREAA
jgi:phage host-nuclease inhibitor protein Gam